MEVRFKTNKLRKCYESSRQAQKLYGSKVAKKYIQRVTMLKSARCFEDLYRLPGLNFHPLSGNRQGQFAIKLTGFWRLIIVNDGDVFDIAKIEEVSDHYGD